MQNSEQKLAEESRKIQKLREKLRQQLGLVEQRVIEQTLKNKITEAGLLEKKEAPSKIVSQTLNRVAK